MPHLKAGAIQELTAFDVLQLKASVNASQEAYINFVDQISHHLEALTQRLELGSKANTIVFHFDEAHHLSGGVTIPAIQSLFGELKSRCIVRLAVVFSTDTWNVEAFVPLQAHPSMASDQTPKPRLAQLISPWCRLPVNLESLPDGDTALPTSPEHHSSYQNLPPPLSKPSALPKDLRSFENQIRIGRPL